MEIIKKCIQCGKEFIISEEKQEKYKSIGWRLPRRCKYCLKYRHSWEEFLKEEVLHFVVSEELERRTISAQVVKYEHFDKPLLHRVKNLLIIGNGFDIWCGLNTRYSDFEKFYESNKIEYSWNLGIEPYEIKKQKGEFIEYLTPFDLLYFVLTDNHSTALDYKTGFWSDFENSLFELNADAISLQLGKEIEDLKDIRLNCDYSYAIIRKTFSEWIKSIDFDNFYVNEKFCFQDCLFINFNYTDTISRKFGVDENDVIHIHGKANDENSIIFGHGNSVNLAPITLQFGGRFAGLYIVQTILKKFYKNPPAQWQLFQKRLQNKSIDFQEIENVYVLGHSLGKADKYYFKQLKKQLPKKVKWNISCFSDVDLEKAKLLFKELNIEDYQTYPSINAALFKFKI